ncbi:hypothetical protein M9434_003373 [Picochlorum sp. BPE23]|nr:hypothetical protein M9434_003373 [Picochlorum sp. BPE23]
MGLGYSVHFVGILWLFLSVLVAPGLAQETGDGKLVVCTLERTPMASCTVGRNESESFTGLSIETFRVVARRAMRWEEGDDYQFLCLDSSTGTVLEEEVIPLNGTCDAFMASTTITAERTEMGVVWAYPYWSGSVGIMTKAVPDTSNGFAWTQPFTWSLWLAIGLTVIVLPIVIYAFELLSIKRSVSFKESFVGYSEAVWRTLWVMIQGETMNVSMFAARIVVIILAFVALILGASYTANLAAFLTLQSFGNVNSVYDLQGLAVSAVPVYQPRLLTKYGLVTVEAKINSMVDIEAEADLVASGKLAAFLTDAEVIQYVVAKFPECRVRMLSNTIEPFDYGLAFNPRIDQSIVDEFSVAILELTEDGTIPRIGEDFLLEDSPCLKEGMSGDEISQISFEQVYGLWILIGGGMALGLIVVAGLRVYKSKRDMWVSPTDPFQPPRTSSHGWEKGDDREIGTPDLLRKETHIHRSSTT